MYVSPNKGSIYAHRLAEYRGIPDLRVMLSLLSTPQRVAFLEGFQILQSLISIGSIDVVNCTSVASTPDTNCATQHSVVKTIERVTSSANMIDLFMIGALFFRGP